MTYDSTRTRTVRVLACTVYLIKRLSSKRVQRCSCTTYLLVRVRVMYESTKVRKYFRKYESTLVPSKVSDCVWVL